MLLINFRFKYIFHSNKEIFYFHNIGYKYMQNIKCHDTNKQYLKTKPREKNRNPKSKQHTHKHYSTQIISHHKQYTVVITIVTTYATTSLLILLKKPWLILYKMRLPYNVF